MSPEMLSELFRHSFVVFIAHFESVSLDLIDNLK